MVDLSFKDFGKEIKGSWEFLRQCNILIVGNTGVGKTTLISSIFNVALGDKITKDIKSYSLENSSSMCLYDTPGFERAKKTFFLLAGNKENRQQDILDFIDKQKRFDKEPKEHIHLVWFCFTAQDDTRIDNIDAKFIKKIAKKNLPIILIRTRSYDVSNKSDINPELLQLAVDIVQVKEIVLFLAKDEKIRGGGKVASFGFDELKEVTEEYLNDLAENSFIDAAQAKKNEAINSLTLPLVGISVAQGIIPPIPYFKSLGISKLQISLVKKIARIFGYQAKFTDSVIGEMIAETSLLALVTEQMPDFKSYLEENLEIEDKIGILEILRNLSLWLSKFKIPFQEELNEVITNIISYLEKNSMFLPLELPILNIVFSFVSFITTLFFALILIETLKNVKLKEYRCQEVSLEGIKEMMNAQVSNFKKAFMTYRLAT